VRRAARRKKKKECNVVLCGKVVSSGVYVCMCRRGLDTSLFRAPSIPLYFKAFAKKLSPAARLELIRAALLLHHLHERKNMGWMKE
jgi:hypothetical protein